MAGQAAATTRKRFERVSLASVRLRPLKREEIPALAAALDESSVAQLENRWQEQELRYRELLVAELADGELAGTVSIRHSNESESMHLFALEVALQLRRRGVGTAIVERVIEEARARGCTRVYLEVRTDNPARRLYHRLGFRRVGQSFLNTWWRFNDDGSRDRQEEDSYRMVRRLI